MRDTCAAKESALLSVPAARQRVAATLRAVSGSERLPLKQALGRVVQENIHTPIDLPPDRNSAVDGYAFNHSDIAGKHNACLRLAGTSWAGTPYGRTLQTGECVRIYTGALVPEGADSVIMQEQIHIEGQLINFPANIKPLQNIRYRGEDICKGDLLLAAGKRLAAIDLGLLASAGISEVEVKRRLKIAYFSTGDELMSLGQPLIAGKIYDSNRYLLYGLLNESAFETTDLGVAGDDKALLQQMLSDAASEFDVIISTGGASVGDADFIHEILAAIGQVDFWKIAIKPGKPLAFGSIGNSYFFGLPGNPVSVLVTYHQIVAPALQVLSGVASTPPLRIQATCLTTLKKTPGRMEFQRGILKTFENGEITVIAAGQQGSHLLAAASAANCYIVLPEENSGVQAGETVTVEPFINFGQ